MTAGTSESSQPASSSWLERFLIERSNAASPIQKKTCVLKCSRGIPPVPMFPSRGIGEWTYVTTSQTRLTQKESETEGMYRGPAEAT